MSTYCVTIFVFLLNLEVFSQNSDKACLQIANRWLKESIDITKNCVGFSAPVSARAFAYLNLGLYECGVEKNSEYVSLSNQLNGYHRTIWKKENENLNWVHVYNYFVGKMIRYLYANMPPYNLKKVDALQDSLFKAYKKGLTKRQKIISENYATQLFNDVKAWSIIDGGNEGYNMNFPKAYKPPDCDSCWTVTVPGYLSAQLPFWGNNRLSVKSNYKTLDSVICPIFSIDTNSSFYKDAKNLSLNSLIKDREIEYIAEYWDDSPGYSGTPTGHLLCLGIQLVEQNQLTLHDALSFYSLLTITINDAFIVCWNAKYKCNLLRPITYIQRYIDPNFNTIIPTPPFPEFPSGHSIQSGAAIEVFKLVFSDTLPITDSSNIARRDINGKPRSFENFTSLVQEISLSRYYGGIHFMNTLNLSLRYGKDIGLNTIKNLQFKKCARR